MRETSFVVVHILKHEANYCARRKHNSICYRILLLNHILGEDEALTDFHFSRIFCKVLQVAARCKVLWKLKEGFRACF